MKSRAAFFALGLALLAIPAVPVVLYLRSDSNDLPQSAPGAIAQTHDQSSPLAASDTLPQRSTAIEGANGLPTLRGTIVFPRPHMGLVRISLFLSTSGQVFKEKPSYVREIQQGNTTFALQLQFADIMPQEEVAVVATADHCRPRIERIKVTDLIDGRATGDLGLLELREGYVLGGRTLNAHGFPVADVCLRALGELPLFFRQDGSELFSATSSDDGSFLFSEPMPKGPMTLAVSRAGLAMQSGVMDSLNLLKDTLDHVIHVREARSIHGVVLDNGSPAEHITVVMGNSLATYPRPIHGYGAWTDSKGRYVLYGDPAGQSDLRVGLENPGNPGDYVWGQVVGWDDAANLEIATGGATIVVREEDGQPCRRFGYELKRKDAVTAGNARTVYTTNGRASLERLLAGSYILTVQALESSNRGTLPSVVELEIWKADTRDIEVVLHYGCRLTVDVKTRDARPVQGTRLWVLDEPTSVWVEPTAGAVTKGITDQEGRADLLVKFGGYHILGRGPGHVPFLIENVSASEASRVVDVVVSAGAVIRARAEPVTSPTLGECVLVSRGDSGSVVRATQREDGVYTWAGVPLGQWDIMWFWRNEIVSQLGALGHVEVAAEMTYDVTVNADKIAPRRFAMSFRSSAGSFANRNISLYRVGDRLRGDRCWEGVTDGQGNVNMDCPVGEFRAVSYDSNTDCWESSTGTIVCELASGVIAVRMAQFQLHAVLEAPDGRPLVSCKVEVQGGDWGAVTVETDKSGVLHLRDAPCCPFRLRDVARNTRTELIAPASDAREVMRIKL